MALQDSAAPGLGRSPLKNSNPRAACPCRWSKIKQMPSFRRALYNLRLASADPPSAMRSSRFAGPPLGAVRRHEVGGDEAHNAAQATRDRAGTGSVSARQGREVTSDPPDRVWIVPPGLDARALDRALHELAALPWSKARRQITSGKSVWPARSLPSRRTPFSQAIGSRFAPGSRAPRRRALPSLRSVSLFTSTAPLSSRGNRLASVLCRSETSPAERRR